MNKIKLKAYVIIAYIYTNQNLKNDIMAKSQDAKKNVKKEATKTPKEKKAEKRQKKSK